MLSQARAEVTRQKILDAAIQLFTESGFSGTNLNTIIRRANVTAGAFYYHFTSKDDVAFAIIDQVAQRMADLRAAFVGMPDSGLESIIEMTFQLSILLSQDPSFRVAAYLEHTMARHTTQGLHDVAERVRVFLADIARAISASELREGTAPEAAADTMLTLVYGCLAMTDLIPGEIATRLAESFRILLPGLAAPDSLPRLEEFLSSALARYRQPGVGTRPDCG